MSIDYGFLRGVITALVFAAFVGVFLWAWSSRRRDDFAQASRLPLDELSVDTTEQTP